MFMSHHQIAGQNHNLMISHNSLKMWQSSVIWEQQYQIKIAIVKKLRAD
jgi:hypothetical protein